jgi:5-amino-6-(5-phosphoribosylamino)uracil reductase
MTRPARPYVLLSCCLSLDGYLDSPGEERLVLSNAADLDRVDEVRAGCDAILVGAGTVRADDPRLSVRSGVRRAQRRTLGLPPTPLKVTVTATGCLDPSARIFHGEDTLVLCPTPAVARTQDRLAGLATVEDAGDPVTMEGVLDRLAERGVRRLMVEGGGRVHTQFLTAGLADELQLAVAPLFVGDSRAPRFVSDGRFPWDDGHRARLTDVRRLGDVVLLRYALSDRFETLEEPISAS